MKKVRVLMLATLMGAAVSGQAFAADISGQSGTMTLKATLYQGTCQLSGQNINHDFGTLSKAMVLTQWGQFKSWSDNIDVTNCPDQLTSVIMTPTYSAISGADDIVSNSSNAASVAQNVIAFISDGTTPNAISGDASLYTTGVARSFSLDGGRVTIPVVTRVVRQSSRQMTAGAAEYNVQLAFTYQ